MKSLRLLAVWPFACALTGCQAPGPKNVASLQADASPRVLLSTSLGDIVVELDTERAPATSLNFVYYVENRYYDGTLIHRVLRASLIQGGAYTADMEPKVTKLKVPFRDVPTNELTCERTTIALLRDDGAGMGGFFINVVDNPDIDRGRHSGRFAVFGRVVEGLDTLETIRGAAVAAHPKYAAGQSAVVPVEPIVIKSARVVAPFDRDRVRRLASRPPPDEGALLADRIEEIERLAEGGLVTTESGLRYADILVGPGAVPFLSDLVEFQYRGTLVDGTEFESTYQTKPALVALGNLIPGLREGLSTMAEGGRRVLIIPPKLAYGPGGIPGRIPSNATLVYEIELLEVKPE